MVSVSNTGIRQVLVIGGGAVGAALIAAALAARDIEVLGTDQIVSLDDVRADRFRVAVCEPCCAEYDYDWDHEEANIRPPASISSAALRPRIYPGKAPKHKGKDLVSLRR